MFDLARDTAAARRSMIRRQLRARGLTDTAVLDAMARVERERFVPIELAHAAYADRALPIDCQQSISQPYMVALMTSALELAPHLRVLEIGTGSGYQTAILSRLAASVHSIERHAELLACARRALADCHVTNVELRLGDGALGWPEHAPFDRILVAAAAESVPRPLIDQLGDGGVLVMPVGPSHAQYLHKVCKRNGQTHITPLVACRFVPLVSGEAPRPPA